MAKLTVNAKVVPGATRVQIQYRLASTGGNWTQVEPALGQLPYSIPDVPNGQYEVQVRSFCANGQWSVWSDGISPSCVAPSQFSVTRSGSNFVVIYAIAANQSTLEVQITDPNGGVTRVKHTGASTGTFNIPIPNGSIGIWTLIARSVCDDTVAVPFVSVYTAAVTVTVGSECNPPDMSQPELQTQDANTATYRVAFNSYTAQVRVRVVDLSNGSEFRNDTIQGVGFVDVLVLKGKNYSVTVFNICAGGVEQSGTVQVNA